MFFIPALGILLLMRSSATEKLPPLSDYSDARTLNIVNTGIFALTPDAMGITFYIHLENNLGVSLDIATRMWECCESFDEGEVDCSHMHLMGGYKGIIRSGQSRNVTLFYPNLYVYNRIGECLLGVWYRDPDGRVKEQKAKVNFDTTLSPRHVSSSIATYYEAEATRVRKCLFIDDDPLDRCRPVDCSRKYNGQRIFYSNVERRCLSAPKCKSTNNKPKSKDSSDISSLPDLIYTPEANTCEDTEPVIKEDDIRTLNSGRTVDHDVHPSNEFDFIICHNGNKSLFTGRCNCHDGWYSTTCHIRPTTLKIHLCTVSRFGSRSSLEDAIDEIIYSVSNCTPELIGYISCVPFTKMPLVIGAIVMVCIFLSILFSSLYKMPIFTISPPEKTSNKVCNNSYRRDYQVKTAEILSNNIKDFRSELTNNLDSQIIKNTSTRELNPNHLSLYLKCYNHSPFVTKAESESFVFSTQSLSPYKVEELGAACSMTPQDKIDYLSRFDTHKTSELAPLLQEESLPNSIYSKYLRNIPRPGEASKTANIWKTTLSPRKLYGKGMHRETTQDIRSGRIEDISSFSKSMAHLTYSTLPSSDSLLSLDETGSTHTISDNIR